MAVNHFCFTVIMAQDLLGQKEKKWSLEEEPIKIEFRRKVKKGFQYHNIPHILLHEDSSFDWQKYAKMQESPATKLHTKSIETHACEIIPRVVKVIELPNPHR